MERGAKFPPNKTQILPGEGEVCGKSQHRKLVLEEVGKKAGSLGEEQVIGKQGSGGRTTLSRLFGKTMTGPELAANSCSGFVLAVVAQAAAFVLRHDLVVPSTWWQPTT